MTLDDTKTVVTPEQVAITYSLAGIGTRFGALLSDTFLQLVVAGVIVAAVFPLLRMAFSDLSSLQRMAPAWLLAVGILAVFAVMWGYYIFWETIWSGQTPGKRLTGIRVMRDGGYPIDFRAAFVRNIVRYVDFLPGFYGIGALVMFLSKESKRLGDYAAGTIVVIDARPAPALERAAPQSAPDYRLLGDPGLLNLRAISRQQFAVIERFLSRRLELAPAVRADMARKIALPLMPVMGMTPPAETAAPAADQASGAAPTVSPAPAPYPYEALLIELAAAYRSRAEN